MIFVVEMPEHAAPSAWFAFDFDDLLRKIEARDPRALTEAAAAVVESCSRCRIFWDESEATAAYERAADPAWQGEGWRARCALREQLVASEVLADDL